MPYVAYWAERTSYTQILYYKAVQPQKPFCIFGIEIQESATFKA